MATKIKKNSPLPILILAIVTVLAIVGYFGYTFTKSTILPSQTSSSKTILQDPKILSFVRSKLSLSQKALIEVTIDEGNYAYGNAGEPDGAGFYWAAVKTNGVWSYIMSGNGIPDCKEITIFPLGTFGGKFDTCVQGSVLIDRNTSKLVK